MRENHYREGHWGSEAFTHLKTVEKREWGLGSLMLGRVGR